MACMKTLLGVSAALLMSASASAQFNTVVEAAPQFDDSIVRAQFIKPGDVSPEEYAALLAEADKIRAFQNSQGAYTGISYDNAPTSSSGSQFVTDTHGYQIELFEAPVTAPMAVTTRSAARAGTVIASTTPTVTYSSPMTATTSASHYVVKGDTLYNIAKRNNVSVGELKAANNMSTNNLKLGQSLVVPLNSFAAASSVMAPVTSASSISVSQPAWSQRTTTLVRNVEPLPVSNIYAVLPKDTLYSISRRACVSVGEITSINQIADASTISPGQRLSLPAGHCLK